jgi:hypothetical protein
MYIDSNNIWSTINSNDWSVIQEIAVITITILKLKKNLFLANFGEIELGRVKWLEHMVHTKLSRALLKVAPFIELCNKPKVARDDLGLTGSDIVAE